MKAHKKVVQNQKGLSPPSAAQTLGISNTTEQKLTTHENMTSRRVHLHRVNRENPIHGEEGKGALGHFDSIFFFALFGIGLYMSFF